MIETLSVQNFKCLKDVTVNLGRFTVFIGPNDSGKTSVLDALSVLSYAAGRPVSAQAGPQLQDVPRPTRRRRFLGNGQFGNADLKLDDFVWDGDLSLDIRWHVTGTVAADHFEYGLRISAGSGLVSGESLTLNGKQAWKEGAKLTPHPHQPILRQVELELGSGQPLPLRLPGNKTVLQYLTSLTNQVPPPLLQLRELLQSISLYRLDPESMRDPAPVITRPMLSDDGGNLSAVLDAIMTDVDFAKRRDVEDFLTEAIPTLGGVSTPAAEQNRKGIAFGLPRAREPNSAIKAIPAGLASDGAMLVTSFLSLAHGNTTDVLLIEEPENGLHPYLQKKVVALLRGVAKGSIGSRPRQVIVTTHSPILLNFTEPAEVRIFSRQPGQGTKITPMESVPNIKELLEEFAAGELWYLLGEDALMKGESP